MWCVCVTDTDCVCVVCVSCVCMRTVYVYMCVCLCVCVCARACVYLVPSPLAHVPWKDKSFIAKFMAEDISIHDPNTQEVNP